MADPTWSVVRASTTSGIGSAVVALLEQLADPRHGAGRRQQAVGPHPLVVVELREVVPAAVGRG